MARARQGLGARTRARAKTKARQGLGARIRARARARTKQGQESESELGPALGEIFFFQV